MSKVLVFLPNSFAHNFIVLLDEIQKEINLGNEVIIVGCEGFINHCEMNLYGVEYICRSCTHCLLNSLKLLKGEYKYYNLDSFRKINNNKRASLLKFESIKSFKEFKNLKHDNYDVGYAVASTYITKTRNHNPQFSEKFKRFIFFLYKDSISIYDAARCAAEEIRPDKVIIFNGRLHTTRPIINIAKEYNIEIDMLEVIGGKRTGRPYEKVRFKNYLPHSIEYNTKLINENWENGVNEKEDIGKSFFENRKMGIVAGDKVYIKNQQKGHLPDNFNINIKNIVIFVSSDDEMAAIGKEWEWSFMGGSQLKAINIILTLMKEYEGFYFYVRVHPNLKSIKYKYHTDYYHLKNNFDNVSVIPADSEISSYSLLENCDKVIVFGSTIGVEATYWNKPSILIGKSIYMNLDVTYNPIDENSLIKLLIDENLKPKLKSNTLKYGYFILERTGEKFDYFTPNAILKEPAWLNTNLLLFNIRSNKKLTINSIYSFFRFALSRFINNCILYKNIPRNEA